MKEQQVHNFRKFTVELLNYQLQPLPPSIQEYKHESLQNRLGVWTTIRVFQHELHWDNMWDLNEMDRRLANGYRFIVCRLFPERKHLVHGWAWLTPEGEIKNVYVKQRFRQKGLGKLLYLAGLNAAYEQGFETAFVRIDVWNRVSMVCFEGVLQRISCPVTVDTILEYY